jgi:hypothetical protein
MNKTYLTHDISIAAWLLMKGLSLLTAEKKNGKFMFTFSDPNSEARRLVLEFAGTQFAVYDGYLRTLRSLVRN